MTTPTPEPTPADRERAARYRAALERAIDRLIHHATGRRHQ